MKQFYMPMSSPLSVTPSVAGRFAFQNSMRCVAALILGAVVLSAVPARSATIDLAAPVSESIGTITGLNWKFDSVTDDTTPDSSGSGHIGGLLAMGGSAIPALTTGVDLPGTSGYGNGLFFTGDSSGTPGVSGYGGNPRVFRNLLPTSTLSMVDTDFTGGAWLKFNSITTGVTQTVTIMGLGQFTSPGQHWTFFATKNTADNWQIGFQNANGTTSSTGFHSGTAQPLNLQDGGWHHLGFTYDYNASADNLVTFWLNGEDIGSATLSLDIVTGATGSTERRFDVAETSTTTYRSRFHGSMDDIFVTTGLHDFQAIPEPTSLALFFLGGALAFLGRRSRTSREGKQIQNS